MEHLEEFEKLKKEIEKSSSDFIKKVKAEKSIIDDDKEAILTKIENLNEARRELAKEHEKIEAEYKAAYIDGNEEEANSIYQRLTEKKAEISRNILDTETLTEYVNKKAIKIEKWEELQKDFMDLYTQRYDVQNSLIAKRKEVEASITDLTKLLEDIKREESRILLNAYSVETREIIALYEGALGNINTNGTTAISEAEAKFDFIRKDYRRIMNMAAVKEVLGIDDDDVREPSNSRTVFSYAPENRDSTI